MQLSQIPVKFQVPFASGAGPSFIQNPVPIASQIGITPGAASFTDGFPPLNFSPISAGGVPPRGADFNGILYQVSAWNQWAQAGGSIPYDATFQSAIGGYPNGAVVQSVICPGNFWQSTVDNNTSNPDAFGANWITPPWAKGTGDWAWRPASTVLANHIVMNGTTIGSAASGATQLASDTTLFVYKYLWDTFSNTQCPVSTGRGATAAADFAANKTIGTLNMQATGIVGVDGMGGTPTGLFAGVPVVSGLVTQPGSVIGENLHTLIGTELAAHTHVNTLTDLTHTHTVSGGTLGGTSTLPQSGSATNCLVGASAIVINNASSNVSINNASSGGGLAHNNTARSMVGYWFMHI